MKKYGALVLAVCLATPALAQEEVPAGAPPLSQILKTIEDGGARTVYSADLERRTWEVVSCPARDRSCREDVIDVATGGVRSSERETVWTLPPAGAKPASEIAAQVEALGIGQITDLEFDDRRWEIEVRNGVRRAEFRIDPMTGATLRCEGTLCP
jgi:hypothetical protein